MSRKLGKQREYETVYVVHPDLADEVVNKEVVERAHAAITKMNGEILREERWGKKKLAYEIKHLGRGNYFLVHYVGPVGVKEELERTLRNAEQVVRFLTALNGEVNDIEARKAEVEKMVRERAADKARQEAERKEREERMERGDGEGDGELEAAAGDEE